MEPKEQARVLNEYYASVFTRTEGEVPEARIRSGGEVLSQIQVTENCVREVIEGLKEDSAAGPDEIPPRIIKELKFQHKRLTFLCDKLTDKINDIANKHSRLFTQDFCIDDNK